MKRGINRSKELTMEVIVGTFVFMVLLVLSMFTIVLSSENIFRSGTRFEAVFPDVMGLSKGDNVVIRGMIVGTVKDLDLGSDGVHVVANIDKKYTLDMRENYRIRIIATSVLGGRLLEITEGTSDAPVIKDIEDFVFVGQMPTDLVDAASEVVDKFKATLEDGKVLENFETTMANIREISDKVNSGDGTIARLINDPALYEEVNEIAREVKIALIERELLKNIEESVANLNQVSLKINEGDGTIARLINDPALYDDASELLADLKRTIQDSGLNENLGGTMANLKEITDKINSGDGSIAKLINDDELYEEVKRLVIEARATVDDLRETSPIVTFSSIFFGAF